MFTHYTHFTKLTVVLIVLFAKALIMNVSIVCPSFHGRAFCGKFPPREMSRKGTLTRFSKIAIPNRMSQMASGQGSHWLIGSPIMLSYYSPPLSVNYIFKHIHTTTINTIIWQMFHSFITICEKEYFFMSNLHCSLTNAALCLLVLLPSLSLKNTFLSISSTSTIHYFVSFWSPRL